MGHRSDVWVAVSRVMDKRCPTGGGGRSGKPVQGAVMESEMLCSLGGTFCSLDTSAYTDGRDTSMNAM